MKPVSRTLLLSVGSVLVAVAAMFLFRFLEADQDFTTTKYSFLWEKVFVSSVAFFSFVFGYVEPKAPWRWPLLMAYVHYFSGFLIMSHWGQIPPFELIYVTLLALPGIGLGYLGSLLAKKQQSASKTP
jgi:hypothetical protein